MSAAAFGGTTTVVDFAIQARGTRMRDALDTWWKKAEGRACTDFGLHMIVTDLGNAGLEDMDDMVREGVASFKLFMAYPNVLMVDDATIFKALSQTAKNGALIGRPELAFAEARWHNRFDGLQLLGRIGSNVDFRRGQITVPQPQGDFPDVLGCLQHDHRAAVAAMSLKT